MRTTLTYTGIRTLTQSSSNGSPTILINMDNRLTLPDGEISEGVSCTELFADIRDSRFVITEDWERDWHAQPKRGTKYYVGAARTRRCSDRKYHPVVSYSFKWEPTKSQLSVWSADNPRVHVQTTITPRAGRALTKLITNSLTAAQS